MPQTLTNDQYFFRAEHIRAQICAIAEESASQLRPFHLLGIIATCPKGSANWEVNATTALPTNRDAATALLRGTFNLIEQTTPGALAEAIRKHLSDNPDFLR